jgi:hypothetical protein
MNVMLGDIGLRAEKSTSSRARPEAGQLLLHVTTEDSGVAQSYGAKWAEGAQGTSLVEQGVAFVFAENTRTSVDTAAAEIGKNPAVIAAMREIWFDLGATRYVNGMANVGVHEVGHLMGFKHEYSPGGSVFSQSKIGSSGTFTTVQYNSMAAVGAKPRPPNPIAALMVISTINRLPQAP